MPNKLAKDDDDEEETFKDWVFEKLNDMFIKSLPMDSIRELPPFYMYVVGTVVQIVALLMFLSFIQQGYQQGITQQYISLQANNGICESVPAPITGQYFADINGNWQDSSGFDYTIASYVFQFQELRLDDDTYTQMIYNLRDTLQPYAVLSASSNLGLNLLLWMVLNEFFYPPVTPDVSNAAVLQNFALTGEPEFVFNRQYITGSLMNQTAHCSVNGESNFDAKAGILSLQYSYSAYIAADCGGMMNPVLFGYDDLQSGGQIDIRVNINSLTVAAGVRIAFDGLFHLSALF
jgi:hypothetical protein